MCWKRCTAKMGDERTLNISNSRKLLSPLRLQGFKKEYEITRTLDSGMPDTNKYHQGVNWTVSWYHKKRHNRYVKHLPSQSTRGRTELWLLDFAFQLSANSLHWPNQMKTSRVNPLWYRSGEGWQWIWDQTPNDCHSPLLIQDWRSGRYLISRLQEDVWDPHNQNTLE